ncbi:MAG: hypothetical protein B0D92_02125, partial [Spirochaeta sp. LUC14_002_19_P3]
RKEAHSLHDAHALAKEDCRKEQLLLRVPLKNRFRKLTKKFFVGRQKLKLREHFDKLRAAEKFESRTKWGFLEVPLIQYSPAACASLQFLTHLVYILVKRIYP